MNRPSIEGRGSLEHLTKRVVATFLHRIDHSQDVFRRNIIHHGVYGADHATTSSAQDLHHTSYFFTHIFYSAKWQDSMRINTSTKYDVLAESFLK